MTLERVQSPDQIAAVAALAREIWVQHYVPLVGQAQIDYMLERFQSPGAIARQTATEGFEYYLAPDSGYLGIVVGTAPLPLLLSKIYVRSTLRGTGLGRHMAEFALQRASDLGCPSVWLTVNRANAGSIAFYEHLGFRITGPCLQDIGQGFFMDDWRMEKSV